MATAVTSLISALQAPSDVDGVLQDVHWYGGIVGGVFQGYTLGNIMSALFYNEALKAHPGNPQPN